jgi:hypothetical protein
MQKLTFIAEKLTRLFPRHCYPSWYLTQQLSDKSQQVLVKVTVFARMRLKKVITSSKFNAMQSVLQMSPDVPHSAPRRISSKRYWQVCMSSVKCQQALLRSAIFTSMSHSSKVGSGSNIWVIG